MIFPKIECDDVLQVNDKFRIRASKTYISKDEPAITAVEIEPDAGFGFIDVTGLPPSSKNWFLDWEFAAPGDKTISVRVTTTTTATITKNISVLSEADDNLFSSDSDLVSVEHDITKYVPDGRSTFKYLHREAQKQILEWLWINGFRGYGNRRLTKENVLDIDEVKLWSKYLTLKLIYQDLSNQPNDVFDQKSKLYEKEAHRWRESAGLRIDVNGDGEQGAYEGFNLTTRRLVRE